jgi:uncharacterized membrane protein
VAEPELTGKTKPHRSRIGATVKALIRTRVMAGVLVVLPIYVTILLIRFVFEVMRDSSQWVVLALLETEWVQEHVWKTKLPPDKPLDQFLAEYPGLDWGIAIFSVLLTILILYAIGVFTANIFGRRLIEMFENFVARVPMVKTVYRSSKQILATLAGGQTQNFQRVALVPFPQEKMRCVGFVTAMFHDSRSGEELACVFIPTTPNPTTGYLQILKRKDLVELDWSVEEAVQTIMSGGILRPDFLTIVPQGQPHGDAPQAKLPDSPPPPGDAS